MKTNNEGQVKKIEQEAQKKSTLDGVVVSCPGNSITPVYKRIAVDGIDSPVVQCVDHTNLQEFIQASACQTDLAVLQKRFIELGEIPAVNPNVTYVDTSVLPSDIHSLYNMVNDVNGNFARLPESVQAVFGDSQSYLRAILDGSYNQKLADAFKPQVDNEEKKEGN